MTEQARHGAARPLTTEKSLQQRRDAIQALRRGNASETRSRQECRRIASTARRQAAFYRELNKSQLRGALPVRRRHPQRGVRARCDPGVGDASAAAGRIRTGRVDERRRFAPQPRFHYLSTVSGGGYIGSWLSAWIASCQVGSGQFGRILSAGPEALTSNLQNLAWLRTYSNYLTPKIGAMSADTWTAAAIVGRNLLLNWLVILPVLIVRVAASEILCAAPLTGCREPIADVCTLSISNPTLSDAIGVVGIAAAHCRALGSQLSHAYARTQHAHAKKFLWFDLVPTVAGRAAFRLGAGDALPAQCHWRTNEIGLFFAWSPHATASGTVLRCGGIALYLAEPGSSEGQVQAGLVDSGAR